MKKVLAAIISYNGREFLPECIDSCRQSKIEILVIDNHSTDDSWGYLAALKNVNLIKNTTNTGFTNAANQAIQYATDCHFNYLLLLNQDTKFETDMLTKLLLSFNANPYLAIVSPMQWNVHKVPEYQFDKNCKKFGIDITKVDTMIVPFVNAACWLMDLKKIKKIGPLNPIFKNYGSDFNYCYRAIYSGFEIGINTKATIIHKIKERDYENNFVKSIKSTNAYYLAKILNPLVKTTANKIFAQSLRGIIGNFLKFEFKQLAIMICCAFYLIIKLKAIAKIKSNL